MADPKNLRQNGNVNNSTGDDRVIWEDGHRAIIEAEDWPFGVPRSKTRDNISDAVSAPIDAGMGQVPIGPQSIRAKKLVAVPLKDLLAAPRNSPPVPTGNVALPNPANWRAPTAPGTPVAPQSPFMNKPWSSKNVPEFPHVCQACGGRFYQGLSKTIHEATEHDPQLRGECPRSMPTPKAPPARRAIQRNP